MRAVYPMMTMVEAGAVTLRGTEVLGNVVVGQNAERAAGHFGSS
jgi:hypothetical protein